MTTAPWTVDSAEVTPKGSFLEGTSPAISGKSRLVKYFNLARIIYMVDVVYVVYLENLNNFDSMNVYLKNLSITLRILGMSAGVPSCHLFLRVFQ